MIAGDLSLAERSHLSQWQLARALLIGALFALGFAVILAFQASPDVPALVVGQASPRTILAPARITFASEYETDQARAKAEAAVPEVYDPPDAELAREQVRLAGRVFEYIDSVRHDPLNTVDQKLEWVRGMPTVTLPTLYLSRTLGLDENAYHRLVTEALYVLDVTMRDAIRPNDLPAEFAKIPSRVSLAFSAEQSDLVVQWAKAFVVPNSEFNAQKTGDLRAQARERVGTVYRSIEKGEAVVREGQVVTPQAIEALEALGILRPRPVTEDYSGPALYAILLTFLLIAFLARLRPSLFGRSRVLLLLAFVLLVAALGIKLVSADREVLVYLYPLSAGIMLISVLVDVQVAIGATMILAATMGLVAHGSLEMAIYALVGGIVAALSLGRIDRLPAFLWAGVYVALANASVVAIFRIMAHESQSAEWGRPLIAAVGNGALAGLIAIGSLFVLGKLFGITTSLELADLARPTHPLLRQLLSDAPGTYHHSLVVSQLAEHAAESIGADSLLVRVAAYYHDVGKISDPQMYIENQLQNTNIHDNLKPEQSAQIVIEHVPRGVTLARQHRLPHRLVDFIPQHHGTTLAAFFHRRAVQDNGAEIDEHTFRYPGPKPQTREAGIMMLADGVEATTRAERPATPEAIRSIIERIVKERLQEGQLDETDLTLRDIQTIQRAFFDVLQGLYHARVRYPESPGQRRGQAEPPETINAR